MKACCSGCGRSGVPSPSTVMTVLPATLHTGLRAALLGRAVDQHHAAAALIEPAAEPRAHDAEIIAQNIQERRLLIVERQR